MPTAEEALPSPRPREQAGAQAPTAGCLWLQDDGSAMDRATVGRKNSTWFFSTSQRCPKQPNSLENIFNGEESKGITGGDFKKPHENELGFFPWEGQTHQLVTEMIC